MLCRRLRGVGEEGGRGGELELEVEVEVTGLEMELLLRGD